MSILNALHSVVVVIPVDLVPNSGIQLELIAQDGRFHVGEVWEKKVRGQICFILSKIL